MKWEQQRIGDLCTVGRGSSPRPINDNRFFNGGEIPWIKVADATASGKYLFETKLKVNALGASFSRLLPPGSLIICTSGTLGLPIFLGVEGCIHDGWLYTYDYKGLDPEFFYHFLQTQKAYFESVAYGAAIQNINTEILRSTKISLPPIEEQRRIADVLKSYDDLIENNRRRMALLEDSARLLYREWFVHLRFPGHTTTRISDGVPEGWRKVELGEICEAVRESVSPDDVEPDTPYIGLEHMPRRSISLGEWDTAEKVTSNKFRYYEGDILFGKIRPYFHKVGIAFTDGIASSDAIVIRAKQQEHAALLLMTVSSDPFVTDAAQSMKEGSKMPCADWKQMVCYPVLIPPTGLLEQFSETIRATTDQLKTLTLQTQKLKTARDLLLPKLMGGEYGEGV